MTFWEFFWLIAFFFIWVAWIWLLIKVFADLFRSDKSGVLKAVWVVLLIFLPFLGVVSYLIANGNEMTERDMQEAAKFQEMQRKYIQDVAAGGSVSTADEIEKLAGLKAQGLVTEEEFAAQKAKLLG